MYITQNFYSFVVYYTLLIMKGIKFSSKKRGPKGEGRSVIYKPVQLPVDLIEDLKLYKDAYGLLFAEDKDEWGNPIPVHVSYEQMLRRWMDNVKKFDKAVQKEVEAYRRIRESRPDPVLYPVDPCDGDIWEMEYTAWRNGEEYPLTVDNELAFYAVIDGEKKGAEQLINEEYELQNDAGIVIEMKDVYRVSKKILKHMSKA